MIVEAFYFTWGAGWFAFFAVLYDLFTNKPTFRKLLIYVVCVGLVYAGNIFLKPPVPEGFSKVVVSETERFSIVSDYRDVFTVRVADFGDGHGDRYILTAFGEMNMADTSDVLRSNTTVWYGEYLPSLVRHIEMRMCDFKQVTFYDLMFYACDEKYRIVRYDLYLPSDAIIYNGYE